MLFSFPKTCCFTLLVPSPESCSSPSHHLILTSSERPLLTSIDEAEFSAVEAEIVCIMPTMHSQWLVHRRCWKNVYWMNMRLWGEIHKQQLHNDQNGNEFLQEERRRRKQCHWRSAWQFIKHFLHMCQAEDKMTKCQLLLIGLCK